MGGEYRYKGVRIISDLTRDEVEGGVLVTGFRGFGLVGYLVSKHLALGLKAEKRGYIITGYMPPVVLIEEDGAGYPFDIYYQRERRLVIVVHRANPEREVQDEYAEALASWARDMGISLAILVGGLSKDFMKPDEEYGYRWVSNKHYIGKKLSAPVMEQGLGVIGPLALLYIHLDSHEIPSVMILPYAVAERVDYEAVIRGLKLISKEILNVELPLSEVERMAAMHKEFAEMIDRILEGKEEEEEEGESGIYM